MGIIMGWSGAIMIHEITSRQQGQVQQLVLRRK
jgi:hypothetical protein